MSSVIFNNSPSVFERSLRLPRSFPNEATLSPCRVQDIPSGAAAAEYTVLPAASNIVIAVVSRVVFHVGLISCLS